MLRVNLVGSIHDRYRVSGIEVVLVIINAVLLVFLGLYVSSTP
jgi:hypothetical protein